MTDLPPVALEEIAEEIEGGFSRRAVAWIVGTVAASFVASILLGVYGKDLERRPNARANTFSYSALGHRALAELLRSLGLEVISRRVPGGGVGPRRPLILAEPDRVGMSGDLRALRDEAKTSGAPLVLVLPKWRGAGRKDKPEWVGEVAGEFENEIRFRLQAFGAETGLFKLVVKRFAGKTADCTAVWLPGEAPVPVGVDVRTAQLFLQPLEGFEPVVACAGGVLAARRPAAAESPQLLVIADPDLLNNHGLGRGENAAVVYHLLTRGLGAEGAVFDETIHGFNKVPGLLNEALSFPMALAVVQSLLLLGVVLWSGMGRFGKPLPAPAGLAAGKEILIDNTAKLLAGGGYAADSLDRFFRQTTRAVAAHYFFPADLPEGERLARLQRLTDARGSGLNLAELRRDIHRLPDGGRGNEPAAKMARRLHQWRVEMTHGNRESP
ncbi:MAG TPA: DUF4350 domain-containing protein [Thermoanaerobaculia bacterium]